MIEVIVLNYLKSVLECPVFAERQNEEPSEFVIIEKTGSGEVDCIQSATIAIQSYSDSLIHAITLNAKVKEAMRNITELATVSDCTLNSDYNYTDQTEKKYRYQAIFDITY